MKRVLVSGASGFIGRQTLPMLVEKGFEVHALHNREPIAADERVHWHLADLLNDKACENTCAEICPTHLLHLAWYVNPKDYKTSPENDRWKDASLALLKAFQKNGGTRAVFTGTAAEYDPAVVVERLREYESPVTPAIPYARTKHETRIAAEEFAKTSGITFAWGRVFNLYGPYEARGRFVPNLVNALLVGTSPTIASGDLVYDYSYVADTAGALVALLDSDVTGIVNIASGKPVTLLEIAETAAEIIGRPELVQKPPDGGTQFRSVADITRLAKEVGWHASYDMQSGLRETISWWQEFRSGSNSSA